MASSLPDPAPPPDHTLTVCIPGVKTVTLSPAPTTRTRDAVVAHKSQALIVADYLRATTEPDTMERAAALYANAAAWELWLATEAWGRGDVWVWHGHVVSALSSAVWAGDWARVGEVRDYLNTGWWGVEHGAEVRAEILAWAATTEARWSAYRNPAMPPRPTTPG